MLPIDASPIYYYLVFLSVLRKMGLFPGPLPPSFIQQMGGNKLISEKNQWALKYLETMISTTLSFKKKKKVYLLL